MKRRSLIIRIILTVIILYIYYKIGIAECEITLVNLEYKYKEILFEDLRKFVDTEKFKVLKGYKNEIKDNILREFLNNLDIRKLMSESQDEYDLKQKIREKFCVYIVKQKNKDFYYFISSLTICILTRMGTIKRIQDNILNLGPGLFYGSGRIFRRSFYINLNFYLYKILEEFFKYLCILGLMLIFPFLIHPYFLDIVSLTRDHFNLADLFPYKYANPFFYVYDYTNTENIIDKNLLTNIKQFFIPKQKGIF